jgi:hypothetical protein
LLQGTSQAVPARRFSMARPAGVEREGVIAIDGMEFSPKTLVAIPIETKGESELALAAIDMGSTGTAGPGIGAAAPVIEAKRSGSIRAQRVREAVLPVRAFSLPGSGKETDAPTALESAATGLDEETRSLLSLIGREAITLDALAEKARRKPRFRNAAAHRLLAGLLELELKGRVKRMPGALFRLT